MITINNVFNLRSEKVNHIIESNDTQTIDATGLTILPALIDPHVHFRTPGAEYKEDWRTGAAAAIAGGVTTVLDMPNNTPACTSFTTLREKKKLIEEQLSEAKIPLRRHLYIGATPDNLEEIRAAKNEIVGIKMFMGASTGNLLVANSDEQKKVFAMAAEIGKPVAVHAEDEDIIQENQRRLFTPDALVSIHSRIRSREAAVKAVTNAIEMAKEFGTTLYILHASTKEEVELIKDAKLKGIKVYAETTPHHLFLDESAYETLGACFAQMNPPLRTAADRNALWAGIKDGTIDTVGTDHAPHTIEEKMKPYGQAPSGVPGIETYLPLLLNAAHEGKMTLEDIARLTRTNVQKIFNLPSNDDVVLVDLNKESTIKNENLRTKCGWSPFAGWNLWGQVKYTTCNGKIYQNT